MTVEYRNNKIRYRINYECYALVTPLDENVVNIDNIICEKPYRNKGLATKLLNGIINHLRNDEYEMIKLLISPTDEDGLSFNELEKWYYKFGFRKLSNSIMILEL